jgi:hypothetical protein
MEGKDLVNKAVTRSMFIESLKGNIKEKYFFEKKLGSGGYGAVYLAKNKVSGKYIHLFNINLLYVCRRESCNQSYVEVQDI